MQPKVGRLIYLVLKRPARNQSVVPVLFLVKLSLTSSDAPQTGRLMYLVVKNSTNTSVVPVRFE